MFVTSFGANEGMAVGKEVARQWRSGTLVWDCVRYLRIEAQMTSLAALC